MIKILTKDLSLGRLSDGHYSGPAVFMSKLIETARQLNIADFVYNESEHFDAVLDGTINLKQTFSPSQIIKFQSSGKPVALRLNGLGHPKHADSYRPEVCRNLSLVSCAIYQSEYCLDAWRSVCGDSFPEHAAREIIFNGDNPDRFVNIPQTYSLPGLTFGAVASWGAVKKIDLIVASFVELIQEGHDVSLLLGGRFKQGVELPYIPQELIEADRIKFSGYVHQRNELPGFLRSCDAYIHLRKGDWCPNAVVEAICAKLPSVVHKVGGTAELTGGSSIRIETHKINDVKSAVIELGQKIKDLREHLDLASSKVDIRNVARQYVDVLSSRTKIAI